MGCISLSDLSSRSFKPTKIAESDDTKIARVSNLAKQYEDLEGLRLENELFTVITYEVVNKNQSK